MTTAADEVLLICSATSARRRAARFPPDVDWDELLRLAMRQRMVPLVRARLDELLPGPLPAGFSEAAGRIHDAAGHLARHNELATLRVVAELEAAGIRSLPLKGALLARDLYGDAALRESDDVDVLVAPDTLARAVESLAELGYTAAPGPGELHVRLVHAGGLPDVELHWRIHWYGERFSATLLGAAEPRGDGTLRARLDHEYAALLLYWARDGFAGLRLAADVAQWWDRFGEQLPERAVGALAGTYPELHTALLAAASHAERLVGVPDPGTPPPAPPSAVRIADWALAAEDEQIHANVALTDVLLAPRGQRVAAVRRRLARKGSGVLHPARVAARWAFALWRVRGGRQWTPLPDQWAPRVRPTAAAGGRPSARA
jgi:hypothetical protein